MALAILRALASREQRYANPRRMAQHKNWLKHPLSPCANMATSAMTGDGPEGQNEWIVKNTFIERVEERADYIAREQMAANPNFEEQEKRISMDGIAYTKQEFADFFGGIVEWELASPAEENHDSKQTEATQADPNIHGQDTRIAEKNGTRMAIMEVVNVQMKNSFLVFGDDAKHGVQKRSLSAPPKFTHEEPQQTETR